MNIQVTTKVEVENIVKITWLNGFCRVFFQNQKILFEPFNMHQSMKGKESFPIHIMDLLTSLNILDTNQCINSMEIVLTF